MSGHVPPVPAAGWTVGLVTATDGFELVAGALTDPLGEGSGSRAERTARGPSATAGRPRGRGTD